MVYQRVAATVIGLGLASAAWAGAGESHGWDYNKVGQDILFHAINFVILAGLLWWFVVPVAQDSVRQRAVTLREDIDTAQSRREAAERRHADLTDRLASIEHEISEMRARATKDAERDAAAIKARAEAAAVALEETVARQIRDESARARAALREEAAEIAVDLAADLLRDRMSEGEQRRLASEFLSTVRAAEEAPHA